MRIKGKLTSWNDTKGFGFITPETGEKQVFVHINAFGSRAQRPEVNQLISYILSADKQGRTCAIKVALAGDKFQKKSNRDGNISYPVMAAIFFLLIVCIAVIITKLPPLILAIYVGLSLFTLIIYAIDKSAAKRGTWRTQESTLHLLSLAGGWPGALIAQQLLRHKSKKKDFRVVFWSTVLINCNVFIWLLTPAGLNGLQSLIENIAFVLPI